MRGEAGGGVLALEFVECVGGVAWAGTDEFARIDGEVRHALNRKPQHRKTVFGGCDGSGLVRRNGGGDQQDLVGGEQFASSLTDDQVAVVDRVEGAAVY